MVKVSVVVPTYRSGPELDHLIASLDAQTLPTSEFEVIFVDDGSPDGTFERLKRVQATRPNVRVEQIENSGWPCRPRNIGTDLARGEYVAYMDHDDLLFPDALRAAYEFAVAHGADVVNGKEARTNDPTWAIPTYREDAAQSIGREDLNPLIPMNPHKLYRRAFLQEHGIRFREGGRVMWEDIFFNLLVERHAKVISTLASVPYYHWHQTPDSGSKGFVRSSPEYWKWLREVFVATQEDLAGDDFALMREQLLAHQYRSRLIASFDGRFIKRGQSVRDLVYDACRRLQADFAPPALDARLNRTEQIRAHLLRTDQRDLLERLPQHDPGLPGWGRATSVRWTDGRLEVSAHAEWSAPNGRRHALVRRDGRILKQLPDEYLAVVPDELRDVTDEIHEASLEFGLRAAVSRVTWMAPTDFTIDVEDDEAGRVRFDGTASAVIDPDTVVFGRALDPGVWDVNLRCVLGRSPRQAGLEAWITPTGVVFGDEVRVAYAVDGLLTISVGPDHGRAVRRLQPEPSAVSVERTEGVLRVGIPLRGLEVQRPGTAATAVGVAPHAATLRSIVDRVRRRPLFTQTPARIEARDGVGVLVVDLPVATRRARLRIGDLDQIGASWWELAARESGQVTLTPVRTARREKPARPGPSPYRRVRSAVRRGLRFVRKLSRRVLRRGRSEDS